MNLLKKKRYVAQVFKFWRCNSWGRKRMILYWAGQVGDLRAMNARLQSMIAGNSELVPSQNSEFVALCEDQRHSLNSNDWWQRWGLARKHLVKNVEDRYATGDCQGLRCNRVYGACSVYGPLYQVPRFAWIALGTHHFSFIAIHILGRQDQAHDLCCMSSGP